MMPWRRHRRSAPRLQPGQQADAWQLVSLLLDYPNPALAGAGMVELRAVVDTLPSPVADPLARFLDHAGAEIDRAGLSALEEEYVDTFDVTRKCCLHLTYFLHGDTRNRGVALVQFKQAFRRAGVKLADGDAELPDHLSVVLEFGAFHDPDTAWKLLNDHRVGIELLRSALERRGSPWLSVVQALRATLPSLQGDDEQALAALIAQGPPQEEVGIDQSPYPLDPALEAAQHGVGRPSSVPRTAAPTHLSATIPVGAPR